MRRRDGRAGVCLEANGMGSRIAQLAAQADHPVCLDDTRAQAVKRAKQVIASYIG